MAFLVMTLATFTARAQDAPGPDRMEPADAYFKAYQYSRTAERLKAGDDPGEALRFYERARKLLQGIQKTDPGWKKELVAARLQLTTEAIARISPPSDPASPDADSPSR